MSELSRKKKIIFLFIVIFIFAIAAEFVLRIAGGFFGAGTEAQMKLEPYRGKPWAAQYFKDGEDCRKQTLANGREDYARFILYDVALNCVTQTINYSRANDRTRKTWNPVVDPGTPKSGIKTIAVFGGSTVEGVGAIDDETIPSWLSRELNGTGTANNIKYIVINYGESGYTYTQAVMKLILKLREGKHFDYVIFYNGVNDIDNAYDNGTPGALFQENWTKGQLEGSAWQKLKYWVSDQVQACATCKAIAVIGRNMPLLKRYISPFLVHVRAFLLQKQGDKQTGDELAVFARGIADYYAQSHGLLDILSKAYGFKYHEFWQPTLVLDAPVRGENVIAGVDQHFSDPKIKSLYRLTRDDMVALHLNNFSDISDVLSGRNQAYYLDFAHVSGDANRVIAERMLNITITRSDIEK